MTFELPRLPRQPNTDCAVKKMAMFVIAGRADCSRYARAEMLADQLAASLPHFRVHKASVTRTGSAQSIMAGYIQLVRRIGRWN